MRDDAVIFHLAEAAWWDPTAPEYAPAEFASDGFVHCSTAEQLRDVATSFYSDRTDLVLLTIDPRRLHPELRWEPGSHGEPDDFPHVYGAINRDAIVVARPYVP